MNPWLLMAKIGAVGVFMVVVFATGHRSGAKAVQRDWDASRLQIAQDQNRLLQENAQKIADVVEKQKETNLTVAQDHERALLEIRTKYDADIAAARAAGGLRLPRSVCSASTGAQTTSPGERDADTSGTVKLPDQVEAELFSEARRADEIVEQARSCQNWIRLNQFYGVQIPTE